MCGGLMVRVFPCILEIKVSNLTNVFMVNNDNSLNILLCSVIE
jgi:hypothetical protein